MRMQPGRLRTNVSESLLLLSLLQEHDGGFAGTSVPVVFALVRAFDGDADVLGLVGG